MEEKPFFTKSEETFVTSTVETWGMLRRHYAALGELTKKDIPPGSYNRLWHYEQKLLKTILELEKKPCLLFVQEENTLPLEESTPSEPANYTDKCIVDETEETVGTYLRSMRRL